MKNAGAVTPQREALRVLRIALATTSRNGVQVVQIS